MKKIIFIFLPLFLIGHGKLCAEIKKSAQKIKSKNNLFFPDSDNKSNIINISLGPLLFNEFHFSYEKALNNKESFKISVPIYFKRDIVKLPFIEVCPLSDPIRARQTDRPL